MAKLKRLFGKIKDKASESKATMALVFRSNTKSLHLALLKSTTHNSNKPPDDAYVAAVLSYSGSLRYASTAVTAALWRLGVTRDACVAAKTLIILHKLIKPQHGFSGEIYINNHLFNTEGRNDLKLNTFRDNSSHMTLELSPWVRWYAEHIDCLSSIHRVLGYFPDITAQSKDKTAEKHRVSCYKTDYIIEQTGSLVSFFEHVRQRPETPPLYRNKIVDEIRELVAQDYFSVMRLVMVRLQELNERLTDAGLDYSGRDALGPILVRLEESKDRLMEFPWRCKVLVEDFWCVVRELKGKALGENKMIVSYKAVDTDKRAGLSEPVWETFDDPVHLSVWETFDDPGRLSVWETFDDPGRLSVWETFDDPGHLSVWETFDDPV